MFLLVKNLVFTMRAIIRLRFWIAIILKNGKRQSSATVDAIISSSLLTDKSIENIEFWKRKGGIFREMAGFIGNIV